MPVLQRCSFKNAGLTIGGITVPVILCKVKFDWDNPNNSGVVTGFRDAFTQSFPRNMVSLCNFMLAPHNGPPGGGIPAYFSNLPNAEGDYMCAVEQITPSTTLCFYMHTYATTYLNGIRNVPVLSTEFPLQSRSNLLVSSGSDPFNASYQQCAGPCILYIDEDTDEYIIDSANRLAPYWSTTQVPLVPNPLGIKTKKVANSGYAYYLAADFDTHTIGDKESILVLDDTEFTRIPSNINQFLHNNISDQLDWTDPYIDGGVSGDEEGGDTDFEEESDEIGLDTLPSISMADTGFTRIYNPSLSQLNSLASYMWTDPSFLQTLANHLKQMFENPMDAFIALNLVPCSVPNGGTTEFKIAYIGTGVQLTYAANQFVDVDCGTYAITKRYDSALDYSPYTKISLFLPYIGTVQLDTDDVVGKTIGVKYRIDIVSGGCVAMVFVNNSIHYQYSGTCAITIPFSSADFTGYISAMVQAAKAATSIAAAGAGAGGLATAIAGMPEQRTSESTTTTTYRAINPETGRMRNVGQEISEKEVKGTKASFGSIVANNFNNTVGEVMGSKLIVERSGTFSGTTGYLGKRRPYLIIERPNMCNPSQYGKYNGRPSMTYKNLGSLTGFTQVQQVQLTGFSATNPELDEIGNLLKTGVIL